jgi:FAD/FMN-containing dehydrogenase
VKEDLQKIIKGEVTDSAEAIHEHDHDASLLKVVPKLVVYPKDAEDIEALVKYVALHKKEDPTLSVTARAAGTCMAGGSLNESIIMDVCKNMHGIISMDATKATVLPGTYYRDFEKETLKFDAILPSYTASKSLNAVGGMVANNSGGEKNLLYGKTERYVEKTKVVFADGNEYEVKPLTRLELDAKIAQGDFEGNIYKKMFELITSNQALIDAAKPAVSKNSAGYYLWNVWDPVKQIFDLNKLISGSQGTLCMISEITFKLVPVQKHSKLYVIFLRDLKPISKLVNDILPFGPESVETYDDHTLKLAIKFLPGIFKSLKSKNFIKFAWSFWPEVFMMLTGGIPKLILLVEFADNDLAKIDAKMKALDEKIKPYGFKTRITKSEGEAEKYWTIRRESFNLLRKHTKKSRTAPFIDDLIVKPEYLPEFMPKLTKILNDYKLVYTVAGHAGDGNFHIIPLMNMHEKKNRDEITEISDKVYDLVLQYKGSITAEHNDGIVRTPYLEKMYGTKVYDLFKQTKAIFDPQNIFNPGKKVGGSLEYLHDHIAEE